MYFAALLRLSAKELEIVASFKATPQPWDTWLDSAGHGEENLAKSYERVVGVAPEEPTWHGSSLKAQTSVSHFGALLLYMLCQVCICGEQKVSRKNVQGLKTDESGQ